MKSLLVSLFWFFHAPFSLLTAQYFEPFHQQYFTVWITPDQPLRTMEIMQVMMVDLRQTSAFEFRELIRLNPQIIELQLKYPTKKELDFLTEARLPRLTTLFVVGFDADTLQLPALSQLEILSLQSDSLQHLFARSLPYSKLDIWSIEAPRLQEWTTDSLYKSLGLIHLVAPKLSVFPIKAAPSLSQLFCSTSLLELPAFLCHCEELSHISITNHRAVPVDDCFSEKIHQAYYSNLTVYDRPNGKKLLEYLSKDQKN